MLAWQLKKEEPKRELLSEIIKNQPQTPFLLSTKKDIKITCPLPKCLRGCVMLCSAASLGLAETRACIPRPSSTPLLPATKLPFPSRGGVNTARGVARELLLRPADVRSPLPLRHPCNIRAMPLQCSCSTLGVPALVAARSWVQMQGQNNISHTWCLCGEPLINLAMKFGVMNYI